jgi:colicin import membrane protein
MTDHSPYTIPKEPGRWRAITLAAVVHAALLVFFWIGIDWQSETPVAVKAELWDMQAKEAAPLPPAPEPTPQPKPEPQPVVKETPKAEPITPPPPKVDIALEKEKKRKEQELKDKLAAEEKERKLKQKAEQDKLDKQAADKKAEQQKKADAEKKRLQDQRDQELSDKRRAEELSRMTGAIGSGGSGQAAKSQSSGRADGAYADLIRARIRQNTNFIVPDNLSGNPAVEFDVELLPDGSLRGEPRLRRSSNLPGFDEAVKRAIERSQPFPPDKSGTRPSRFIVVHKPKDQ